MKRVFVPRAVALALVFVVLGAGAASAQTRAYVTNQDTDTVSVIDTANNTVIATVPVGTFTNPSFKSQGACIKYVNGL